MMRFFYILWQTFGFLQLQRVKWEEEAVAPGLTGVQPFPRCSDLHGRALPRPMESLGPGWEQPRYVCMDAIPQQMVNQTSMSLCVLCTFHLLVMNLQIL